MTDGNVALGLVMLVLGVTIVLACDVWRRR